MVKVGIYIRVSTEDQAREGHSLDEQEARFRIDPASAMMISHTLARLNNAEQDINKHIMGTGYSF